MSPLLLCDLDDTVLDRAATFERWVDGFLAARGVAREQRAWLIEQDDRGFRPKPELFAVVRERFGLTEEVDELVDAFERTFGPMFRCADDVREVLVRARADGWKIALVTNGPPSQERKILAAGLPDLVDAWCISSVDGWRKPDVRLLELAAERCGQQLAGAWMIGDSPEADIGAAHAAGIPSVWMACGRSWPDELAFAPTLVARSFPEAVEAVLSRG